MAKLQAVGVSPRKGVPTMPTPSGSVGFSGHSPAGRPFARIRECAHADPVHRRPVDIPFDPPDDLVQRLAETLKKDR